MAKHLVFLALAATVLAAAFLTSGRKHAEIGENIRRHPRTKNSIHIDIPTPLLSLSPADPNSGSSFALPLIYSYLAVPDENDQLEPDLAESWSYDPASFTWTINLRKNALWHDGRHVSAKDVKNCLLNNPAIDHSAIHSLVKDIIVTADYSLRIALKENDPDFLKKIWTYEIFPIPQPGDEHYYNHPIGSGPFTFNYKDGDRELGLTANPNYFKGKPSIDQIVIHYEKSKEKSWERLLTGETDIVYEMDPIEYDMIKKYRDKFYFNLRIAPSYSILLYNINDPLFSDQNVRTALSYAIDKKLIIERFLKGYGELATGPIFPESCYHNPSVKPIPYDLKKALELLESAGWSRSKEDGYLYRRAKRFEFTLSFFENIHIDQDIAKHIQLCLDDIGIKVHVQKCRFSRLLERFTRNDKFQAVLTQIQGIADTNLLHEMWCPVDGKKALIGSFEDPLVTDLFKKAVKEHDPRKKKELFYEIDARMASLQPGTFLYQKTKLDVMSRRIDFPFNFSMDNRGIASLWRASIKEAGK